jgi:tetratricopeptide (TPR) repeat protein
MSAPGKTCLTKEDGRGNETMTPYFAQTLFLVLLLIPAQAVMLWKIGKTPPVLALIGATVIGIPLATIHTMMTEKYADEPVLAALALLAVSGFLLYQHWFPNSPKPKAEPVPQRPPTAAETKQAVTMLRLARKCMDDAYNKGQPFVLTSYNFLVRDAAKALERAKVLDAGATLPVQDKDFQHTYTIDELTGELCYIEALGYKTEGQAIYDPQTREERKKRTKFYTDAIASIDKALNYHPQNVLYLREKAGFLDQLGKKKEAIEVIDYAVSIAPDDLESLRVQMNIRD